MLLLFLPAAGDGGQTLADFSHNIVLAAEGRLADGVQEGPSVGVAVGLDDRAADAQKEGSPHLAGVHPLFKGPYLPRKKHRPQLGEQGGKEHPL